ncbi:MAG: hypothetical protein KKA05_06600 [Alphaproteobacteria bacterium]|nr:hypothetical protein [Alphaproteobacteria bacterium]
MIKNILLLAVTIFFLHGSAAYAENIDWENLAKEHGATLSITKDENGKDRKKLDFPGGVIIQEVEGGTLGIDNSGLGAVSCIWRIFVSAKSIISLCKPDGHEEMEKNIDTALDMINGFIIENSIAPVTEQEITDAIKKDYDKQAQYFSEETGKPSCPENENIDWIVKLAKSDVVKSTEKLISVPRPPVMNPCL